MTWPLAVLFDFDYTLADSSTGIVECTNHALQAMGHPTARPDDIRRLIGLPLEVMLARLTGVDGAERGILFRRLYVERADTVMLESTLFYPGVARLAETLRDRGTRLAIVSTKYAYRIHQALARDGLDAFFELVIGSDAVHRPKPDPEALLLALSRLQVGADDALFVGDSPADAAAAAAAGVRFVGVLTGPTAGSELTRHGPWALIDHVAELAKLLERGPTSQNATPEGRTLGADRRV